MRVALLTSDDPHHKYLVALLAARFDVCGVIVEPEHAQLTHLLRRRRYKDWCYRRYHSVRRKLNGQARYRQRFFSTPAPTEYGCETVEVGWINSELVTSTMRRWRPDVTIVCGTTYVSNRVLTHAGRALNIHAGCLPRYRGNHGIFFALAEGQFDSIGASLHEVETKLDGGALIEVVRPPVYPHDNDETLYCRSDQLTMLRLVEVLSMLERGEQVLAHPQPDVRCMFRHCDRKPWIELRVWLLRRLGFMKVPCIPIPRIATTVYSSLGRERLDDPLIEYSRLGANDPLRETATHDARSADR